MYDFLRGTVVRAIPGRIVLGVGGVGYDLIAPLSTTAAMGRPGTEVMLLVHLVVREDDMRLYAFSTEDERSLFRTLIGLSGIGAATAIQILSSTSPKEFLVAIEKQDASFLKRIKGIGEKTAKRIILELKGAKTLLPAGEGDGEASLGGVGGDAVLALQAMGVPQKEAVVRVETVLAREPGLALEEIIKTALRG